MPHLLTIIPQWLTLPLSEPVAIFFTVLVMILLTPVVLQRLKIPHIVGMIVAGIIIGPHGFHILDRDASFQIFGQVGILYLMFLAGVEIDMLNLKRNWRQGVKFGLMSFAFPMIGGLLVSRYMLGTSWLTASLISSMLASHTLISYPIATRFGLTNTRASVIAVCGTIVSVLLALIVLAEVVDIKLEGSIEPLRLIYLFLWIVVYAVGVWFILSKATRWFFKRINDRVSQFIFIMAEVLFAALLAQVIGLEGILGAFYAGLVLNRFIPSRSGLMTRIEFVGNAIFIPYFLIGVGMLMNIGVIFQGWYVIYVAICMTATALAFKWLATYSAQRMFRLNKTDRRLMFGLTSGKAAATIAATIIGFSHGLITEDIMNGSVIMILICCAIASVATEQASKRMRMGIAERELLADNKRKDYGAMARQLVAVSNPTTAEGLMRLAVLMRGSRNKEAMTALFVRNNDDDTVNGMGRNALKSAVKYAVTLEMPVDDIERFDVNTVTGIANVVKERHCSEIVIGLHRRTNIVDTFYGSMTEQLLRTTNLMVVMSRCYVPVSTLRHIVVVAPKKAEYETGFSLWVARICTLSATTGAPIVFIAYPETAGYIRGLISQEGYHLDVLFKEMTSWDDFITYSGEIDDEDLFVVVGARSTSISFNPDLEMMPAYLSRYFSRNNLLIIYPEQFGADAELPTPVDALATTITTVASGWKFTDIFRRGHKK